VLDLLSHRIREIWRELDLIDDPELDESIVKLKFVQDVKLDGARVVVLFRLPTYWCSPNFAFLMVGDIRKRIMGLCWVSAVDVSLIDHCASDVINHGANRGRSFEECFPGETDGGLRELRHAFRQRAFMTRQERIFVHLKRAGCTNAELVKWTAGQLQAMSLDAAGDALRDRYLAIRRELSLDALESAFTTVDGERLDPDGVDRYLRRLRAGRLNMEINTHLCSGLLEARYGLAGEASARRENIDCSPMAWVTNPKGNAGDV
jgi:metal-sulfur cluster biosynthetic enzyme